MYWKFNSAHLLYTVIYALGISTFFRLIQSNKNLFFAVLIFLNRISLKIPLYMLYVKVNNICFIQYCFNHYLQVTCITTNNTFNDSVTVNSVSYYNTSDSSTTSLTIESLYSQVEYSCTVKAILSENEFGESSREVVFWTKPVGG